MLLLQWLLLLRRELWLFCRSTLYPKPQVAGGKEGEHRFAGRTLSGDKPVLLSFIGIEGSSEMQYKLHVENVVLGSSLQSALVKAFE